MKILFTTVMAGVLSCGSVGVVQAQVDSHVIAAGKDARWGAAPPMLPPALQSPCWQETPCRQYRIQSD